MRTIKVKVFEYDELNADAKEKARGWWAEGYDSQFEWDCMKDDAENVGLVLEGTNRGSMEGHFKNTALDTAKRIIQEHGNTCETYKNARKFTKDYNQIIENETEKDGLTFSGEKHIEELEDEFLRSLLEDYRIMLEKDYEYNQYGVGAIESIRANEYTFTKDGKRFG